jgi:phosphate transport system protein
MTHLETELQMLKTTTIEMWHLVISQLSRSQTALINFDKEMVCVIKANEKMVNAFELKIDKDCENIIALFNPVAVDLRFVLSVLKINYNLERIGDYAKGISKLTFELDAPFSEDIISSSRVFEMFDICINLLIDSLSSFENENSQLTRSVFGKDKTLNKINKDATQIVANYIINYPENVTMAMNTLSIIRKLERVGDHIQNLAEELIFYKEAKVLKHQKKKTEL